MLAKAASKRMQSDARIDSAEREQVRPKVNGMVVMTIIGILLFLMWKNASFCDFIGVFGANYGISGWQSRKS